MVHRFLRFLIFIGCGWVGVSSVYALDREHLFAPITVVPQAKTWRDVQAVHHAWAKRMLLDPFRVRAAGKPWSKEAMRFADKAVDYLAPSPDRTLPPDALYQTSQGLIRNGCRDPLIVLLDSRLYELHEDTEMCSFYVRDALAEARKLEGPKVLAWLIARDIAGTMASPQGEDQNARYDWAVELGQQVVADGSYRPEEDVLFLLHLFPSGWDSFVRDRDRLRAIGLSSQMGEWLKEMLLGCAEWAPLTGHFAEDLQGNEKASRYLQKAKTSFERAWELRPDRPQAAAMMVNVSFYLDPQGHEDRMWFDRAVAAQFDYLPAYWPMLDHCLPANGGSVAMMLEFGEACQATGRYDTIIPELYRAAVTNASHLVGDWRELYHQPEIAKRLLELSKTVLDEPTRQEARRQKLDFYAVNAYLAGEMDLAASLRRESKEPLCRAAANKLSSYNIFNFDEMMKGRDADAAALQAKALQLEAAGSYAAAQQLFEEAVSKAQGSISWQLQWQAGNVDFQRRFASGDWVALPEDRTVRAWWGMNWALPKNRVNHAPDVPIERVAHDYTTGEHFEVRGQFIAAPAAKNGAVVSLFLGERTVAHQPGSGAAVWTSVQVLTATGGGHSVKLDFKSRFAEVEEFPVEIRAGQNSFVLRREGKKVSLEINGEMVFENREDPEDLPLDGEMVFGYDGPPEGALPEKIEIRKLPQSSRPLREKA